MPRSGKTADWIWAATVFLLAWAIFALSPVRQAGDPFYSILLGENLYRNGSLALDGFFEPPLDSARFPGLRDDGLPYHLERVGEHLYYRFPPGSSVLSVPLIAAFNLTGVSAIAADGTYDLVGEVRLDRRLSTLLAAALAAIVFLTARLVLPLSWSLLLAFGVALGTQVWSTASRALWSHDWAMILVGLVLMMMVANESERQRPWPVLWATLLAWAFFTRPTTLLSALAVAGVLALRQRSALPRFVVTLGLWLALFATCSFLLFGQILPSYYLPGRLGAAALPAALVGNLVSPSRGLLVFTPWIVFVAYLLVAYRARVRQQALTITCVLVVALHWLAISAYHHWWAGHSYGPRLFTDVIPWLGVAGILGVRAWLDSRRSGEVTRLRLRTEATAGLLLLVLAIGMHGAGALSLRSAEWNICNGDVDRQPERLWNWSRPQFLAWLQECPAEDLSPAAARRSAAPPAPPPAPAASAARPA